jgi:hypothetical protein
VFEVSDSSEVVRNRVLGLAFVNTVINLRFSLERGNSSLAEEQSAFQETLCTMEVVSFLY